MPAPSRLLPPRARITLSPGPCALVALGGLVIGAGAVIFLFNPATHQFYPVCLFHAVTGLNCPGCGATRALYALLHGNLRLALKDNALFVATLAGVAIRGAQIGTQILRRRPATVLVPAGVLWLLLAAAVVFAVVRNLPGFEWLSP